MPATKILEGASIAVAKRQWWLEEIVEDAPPMLDAGTVVFVEVAYYAIRWWAFPCLVLLEAAQHKPAWWAWPRVLLGTLMQWSRFMRARPTICREVRIRYA